MCSGSAISAEHPRLTLLESWLDREETRNTTAPRFCHLLLRQRDDVDPNVWNEMFDYINHAHEGVRQ